MTTTAISTQNIERAKHIVGDMLRSERFANYCAEERNDFINNSDRASRCYDAAENGADGSTHSEAIQDMRDFWRLSLQWRGRELPYRVDAAVSQYFDNLEEWREQNGSLWEEIG